MAGSGAHPASTGSPAAPPWPTTSASRDTPNPKGTPGPDTRPMIVMFDLADLDALKRARRELKDTIDGRP